MDIPHEPLFKEFRFRTRFIRASAHQFSFRCVYQLDIPQSPIRNWLLSWLPSPIRSFIEGLFPEWFLPPRVILKERNPEKSAEFQNEVNMYRRLRHLQGIDIPRCFGIVYMGEFDPALLLSYIEGKLLYQLSPEELLSSTLLEAARTRTEFVSPMPRSDIANPQLLPQLRRIYSALAENGVAHGDPRLDNFIQTKDGRVVAIDLEFAHLDPYDAGNTDELNSVLNLMGNTVDFQSLNNPAVYRLAKEDYKKRMAEREDQPLPWHPPSPLPSMSGNKAAGG